MSSESKYIIVDGNPVDGLNFIGPFDTDEEAVEYAGLYVDEWWIATIEPSEKTA
jgi:hypothetical protein